MVTVAVLLVTLGLGVGAWRWWHRPVAVAFDEGVKETTGECTSVEPLSAAEAGLGFPMTCTMVDAAPGNRDRPYVQLRLDGCDDWQRLDHDDGIEPVVLTVDVEPCGTAPTELQWQVCQTHGGLLPDDCDDGTTELPTR